jgi:transitional endoplasmic reticulum ATPase
MCSNILQNYLSCLDEPVPSLYVKSLDNKCNTPQYSVSEIFKKARKMAPCLLVFEDLDSLIVDSVRSVSGTNSRHWRGSG